MIDDFYALVLLLLLQWKIRVSLEIIEKRMHHIITELALEISHLKVFSRIKVIQ